MTLEVRPPALYFAQLCALSYSDAAVARRGWRHRGADVEVLLDRAPWGVTYAWRGTNGLADALRDIRMVVPWWDDELGWCAAGNLKGVNAIWEALEPSLDAARADGVSIYCAGHSLGGSEATVMAARLAARGYPVAGLFTAGAPKPSFGDRLRSTLERAGVRTLRLVADGDPVPSLPPVPLMRHPCPEYALRSPADAEPDHPIQAYIDLIPSGLEFPGRR